MPRRNRHQVAGWTYHVAGRGCRGEPIFGTVEDCEHFLRLLDDVVERFDWHVLDWTLMSNHHHLVIRLRERNLSDGVQRLHSLFAQGWNDRHDSTGHVFYRRYTSVEVLTREQLETLILYVDVNPVRAGLCTYPHEWRWAGYSANAGVRRPRRFHDDEAGARALVADEGDLAVTRLRYARRVELRAARVAGIGSAADVRPTLAEVFAQGVDDAALDVANTLWGYSTRDIAAFLGQSQSRHREITFIGD